MKQYKNEIINLEKAFLSLRTENNLLQFLKDICTPQEINALRERWKISQMLYRQKYTYREINKRTGASLATITRVARFINNESNEGYKFVIKKLEKKYNER